MTKPHDEVTEINILSQKNTVQRTCERQDILLRRSWNAVG